LRRVPLLFGNKKKTAYLVALAEAGRLSGRDLMRAAGLAYAPQHRFTQALLSSGVIRRLKGPNGLLCFNERFFAAGELCSFLTAAGIDVAAPELDDSGPGLDSIFGGYLRTQILVHLARAVSGLTVSSLVTLTKRDEDSIRYALKALSRDGVTECNGQRVGQYRIRPSQASYSEMLSLLLRVGEQSTK